MARPKSKTPNTNKKENCICAQVSDEKPLPALLCISIFCLNTVSASESGCRWPVPDHFPHFPSSSSSPSVHFVFRPFTAKDLIDSLQVNWTATRFLECTAEDWSVTASSRWSNSNWCMKMSTLIALGRASTLMSHCRSRGELVGAGWCRRRLIELIALARWMWRSLASLLDLMRWLWLSLVIEIDYDIVILDALFRTNTAMLTEELKSWKQVHWRCYLQQHHLHTAPRLMSTVQLITDCVYHWFCKYRSLHICTDLWHWVTESMSRGSAKIHAMYPHHCALHGTVKHTDCLAQVTVQKGWLSPHWID